MNDNRPHPNNIPGPFYVVRGCCTSCDVPFAEAPGHFTYDENCHCFVSRQPDGERQTTQFLRAAWAAEFECIRYRGTDPGTIRRLAELGRRDLCDAPSAKPISIAFRNHVVVSSNDPLARKLGCFDILSLYRDHLIATKGDWITYEFKPIAKTIDTTRLTYSWFQGHFHDIDIFNIGDCGGAWLIRHSIDDKVACHGISMQINDWLTADGRFSSIRWYTEEQWTHHGSWQESPI